MTEILLLLDREERLDVRGLDNFYSNSMFSEIGYEPSHGPDVALNHLRSIPQVFQVLPEPDYHSQGLVRRPLPESEPQKTADGLTADGAPPGNAVNAIRFPLTVHAQPDPMEEAKNLEVTIHVEAAFETENVRLLSLSHDAANVSGRQSKFHFVGVRIEDLMECLQQAAGMLNGVVVAVVRILEI